MALDSRSNDERFHGAPVRSRLHCQFCGLQLDGIGFHFECHVCGAGYCYVHMRRHERAHGSMREMVAQVS